MSGGLEDRRITTVETAPPVLTQKQAAVLAEIIRYRAETGDQCRVSYLERRFKLSRAGVRAHIAALHRKGWLRSQESPFRLRREG